jgi:hypothetical protein
MRGKFLSYTTRLVALLLLCGILSGASKIQSATLIPIALSAEPALMIDNHIPLSARLLPQQVATSGTADVRVAAGNDDAEQEGADGSNPGGMYLTSSDLELVMDVESPTSGSQQVGMRFTGVNVPAGAVITNAYIRFRATEADSPNTNDNTADLTIRGQADNPTTFTSTANDISGRPTTSAAVAWKPSAWATGTNYDTPDLTSVVQEVVNRSGWAANQSMAFIITGSGSRSADSYDGSTSTAPLLHIEWRLGGIFLPLIIR